MKSPVLRVCGIMLAAAMILATTVAAQTACKVVYTISPQNNTAFGAAITIQNTGTTGWSSWSLSWAFANGQTVSSLWNGNETQSGANVTVTNESYNGSVAAGGSVTGIGFNGTWNGVTNAVPASFAVNGTTCGGSVTGSFSLAPAAATVALAQGASTTDAITVTDLNGFTGAVTLAATSTNTGVTATVNGDVITLTASATATGSATITVTGSSGTLKATTTITVNVSGAGGFTLSAASAALSVTQGATAGDTISIADISPFSGNVTLSYSTLPTGVTAAFSANPSATSSTLTFTASATATAGTYPITVTGVSGSNSATTLISLTVAPSACVPTVIIPYLQVNSGAWQQTNAATVALGSIVNLGPQPVTGGTWLWSGPNGFTSTTRQLNGVVLHVGVNIFTVTYTSANGCKSTLVITITVTSSGSFTVAPSSATQTIALGSSSTDAIVVTDQNGFTGSITCSASGLPIGMTAGFSANPFTATSLLTFSVGSTVPPGTYVVTITCTSGTTTYTFTITITVPASSNANATVTVNPANTGAALSNTILGMNMAAWYDPTTAGVAAGFEAAGIKAVRWPGGSWADGYNWETNTECGTIANPNAAYSDFVNDLVKPAGLDVSLIADYGTGKNCTGYGDPTEAASWASESLTLGANVSHITVGNEEYGTWETDHHPIEHDPTTYANAVASGYYPDIKAASPNVLVGVLVQPDYAPWDQIVMSDAKYDFVEFHYYPETPGEENDTTLINSDAAGLTTYINKIKAELTEYGHSGTPIYVGEIGGPYSNPGKQSWSITQGLYAGQVLGEMMNDGVTRLTWWIGYGNCNGQAGNDSSSVYGWQTFGAYNVFSDGPSDPTCPNAGPIGTMSPTARAFQLFSQVAINGEHALTPTVTGDTTDVVAYAATNSGGEALVLFNRNENNSETVQINVSGKTTSTSVTETTYDKAIYDLSQSDDWAPPTTTSLGAQSLPLTLTLAPWSMNVVIIH